MGKPREPLTITEALVDMRDALDNNMVPKARRALSDLEDAVRRLQATAIRGESAQEAIGATIFFLRCLLGGIHSKEDAFHEVAYRAALTLKAMDGANRDDLQAFYDLVRKAADGERAPDPTAAIVRFLRAEEERFDRGSEDAKIGVEGRERCRNKASALRTAATYIERGDHLNGDRS